MAEQSVLLVLCTLVAVGFILMGRPDVRASAFWTWGWLFIVVSGVLRYLGADVGALEFLSNPLSTLYAAMMVVGALSFAKRKVPSWLILGSIGIGLCSAGFAAMGVFVVSHGVALAVEPPLILTAALVMFRDTRGPANSVPQRLVAPALVVVAAVSGWTHFVGMSADAMPESILLAWITAGAFTLPAQLVSVSDRIRQALFSVVGSLEESVAERTAHLEREIAVRRNAEAALRASEERANAILELSSDYTFASRVERDGRVTREWLTGPVRERLGVDRESLLGADWLELIHPDDLESTLESIRSLNDRPRTEFEARVISANGAELWMHLVISAMRSESDGRVRFVGAARDITKRKAADEVQRELALHMQEVQKLESLGVLAGGIAHDFNNLLTVILGNSRMLLTDLAGQPAAHNRVGRVRVAAEHAADLVDQMLTYSGRPSPTIQPLDLSRLVERMGELLRTSVSGKCKLEFDLAAHLPAVDADATQIRQVVLNLATNGAEALGSREGTVRVSSGVMKADAPFLADTFGASGVTPGEFVYLEVADTGPGIDAATHARIFEPFYTTKFTGRGLGLAAVLGIVRSHHGVIKITSSPEEGTAFRVLYPCSASRALAEASLPRQEAVGRTGTVLLVDDDSAVLEVSTLFLQHEGFTVISALGGQAGIDIFTARNVEIDAVVLDLAMPDIDGEEAFAEIHRLRPAVPVILASGFSEEMAHKKIDTKGFVGFIQKPYDGEDLAAKIRSVLEAN